MMARSKQLDQCMHVCQIKAVRTQKPDVNSHSKRQTTSTAARSLSLSLFLLFEFMIHRKGERTHAVYGPCADDIHISTDVPCFDARTLSCLDLFDRV